MIEIEVNGEKVMVIEGCSLHSFLIEKKIAYQKGVAVAINEEVISKTLFQDTILKPKDQIIIIQATAGG